MKFAEPQWLERVTSTNTILLERLARGERLVDGFVLAATEQTAGRGRGDRRWQAQPGRDLSFSVLCRTTAPPRQLASLAMAAAVGIIACLRSYGVCARGKWPNDVVVTSPAPARIGGAPPGAAAAGGAKIAGILCECSTGAAVVGIGLNVSMAAAEAERIDQAATSILMETGAVEAPRDVLPRLLDALAPPLQAWREGGFTALRHDWESCCLGLGQEILIDEGHRLRRGRLHGFGDAGQLLLDEGSCLKEIWSGHLRWPGCPGAS